MGTRRQASFSQLTRLEQFLMVRSLLQSPDLRGFDRIIVKVPVNLKNKDAFHLTIEEYLLALVSLVEELARLARNSVTLGDFRRPLQISQFIKDVHAGFQILNLKNDILRRRVDGIKYRVRLTVKSLEPTQCFAYNCGKMFVSEFLTIEQVKEVEDVVYDLSLRNLLPKDDGAA